jgi:ADP-ribose pyrophosphatase
MELLDVQKYSPNEIEEMIFSGRFQQAVHVAAWLLARRQ